MSLAVEHVLAAQCGVLAAGLPIDALLLCDTSDPSHFVFLTTAKPSIDAVPGSSQEQMCRHRARHDEAAGSE